MDGRFSLKTNQKPDEIGEMLITEESTFKLEKNKEYELGFIYSLADASPNYSVTIKSLSKGELVNIPLKATTDENGKFAHRFTTGNVDDYYLSIDKQKGFKELIVDNIYVTEIKNEVQKVEIKSVNIATSLNELKVGQSTEILINGLMADNSVANLDGAIIEYIIDNKEVLSITDGKVKALSSGDTNVYATVTLNNKTVKTNTLVIKVKGEVVVDKVKLELTISDANKLNRDDYTVESYNSFEGMLNTAKEILVNEKATQEELNDVNKRLVEAISGLVKNVDKDKIKKILKLLTNLS